MPQQQPDFRTDIYGYPDRTTTRPSGGGGSRGNLPGSGGYPGSASDDGGRSEPGWSPPDGYDDYPALDPYIFVGPEQEGQRRRGGGGGPGLFGLSSQDTMALLSALAGLAGGMGKGPNTDVTSATSDPNMRALMEMMQGRLTKSEPLYDSILAMANGLLPTQYQRSGVGAMGPAGAPAPVSSSMPVAPPVPQGGAVERDPSRPPRTGLPPARGPVRTPVVR